MCYEAMSKTGWTRVAYPVCAAILELGTRLVKDERLAAQVLHRDHRGIVLRAIDQNSRVHDVKWLDARWHPCRRARLRSGCRTAERLR